jgi:hypothetical protein
MNTSDKDIADIGTGEPWQWTTRQLVAAYPGAANMVCFHEGLIVRRDGKPYPFEKHIGKDPVVILAGIKDAFALMLLGVVPPPVHVLEFVKQYHAELDHPDFLKYVRAKLGAT